MGEQYQDRALRSAWLRLCSDSHKKTDIVKTKQHNEKSFAIDILLEKGSQYLKEICNPLRSFQQKNKKPLPVWEHR